MRAPANRQSKCSGFCVQRGRSGEDPDVRGGASTNGMPREPAPMVFNRAVQSVTSAAIFITQPKAGRCDSLAQHLSTVMPLTLIGRPGSHLSRRVKVVSHQSRDVCGQTPHKIREVQPQPSFARQRGDIRMPPRGPFPPTPLHPARHDPRRGIYHLSRPLLPFRSRSHFKPVPVCFMNHEVQKQRMPAHCADGSCTEGTDELQASRSRPLLVKRVRTFERATQGLGCG